VYDMNDKYTENQGCEGKSNDSEISRRGFLGVGSAALATVAGTLALNGAMAQDRQQTAGGQSDRTKSDPGPSNKPLDTQNPDSEWPPDTDSQSLVRTFKYPFSFANKRS
jgi:oxalate decarboxylase